MASKAEGRRNVPWRIIGWGTAAVLLLIPLFAGFPWTLSDFVFAGAIFAIVGGVFELAVRRSGNLSYRGGVTMALATAFLLVWINGAVGIIGNEDNPANLMFLGVIAIAITGSIVARFKAYGMARAMVMAAAAQALVGVVALVYRLGANEPPFYPGVLILIFGFCGPWLLSAWLFRRAPR